MVVAMDNDIDIPTRKLPRSWTMMVTHQPIK